MTWLLDGNLLAALAINTHEHHARAWRWFLQCQPSFATCIITEGTLLRLHMQKAADTSASAAWKALAGIQANAQHVFWDDVFSYAKVPHDVLQGHKQVTDAWLATLTRRRGGKLATMDSGLATLHSDIAMRIP